MIGDIPYPPMPAPAPQQFPHGKVRIFTSITQAGGKRYFDVPLLPVPTVQPAMIQPDGSVRGAFTPWTWFMTNLLQHRGLMLENAWIPERVIEMIVVNPDTGGIDPEKFDLANVIALKPPA